MKKLKLIRRLILLLIVFGLFFTAYYTYAVSPNDYTFSTYNYVNKDITSALNGFKIAYISDINLTDKESVSRLKKMIDKLNSYPFDMVVFGGDLYDGTIIESKDVSAALKDIECKYGKFAILGEKDNSSSLEVTQILNDGRFEVLENTARTIHYKEASFLLLACHQDTDISSLKGDTKTIKIGITHQPDSFQNHKGKLDLQLSGHSYGGSIYIPYYGALLAPDNAKIYNHGIYEESNSVLLVSNGFHGPASFPYKFLARNEVNFITLNTSSNSQ
ncbi:MAG: metallophosphoesterase [Coprobacillus cateniformis]